MPSALLSFTEIMNIIGYTIEAFGVLVIVIGLVISLVKLGQSYRFSTPTEAYKIFRQNIGRSIILGLEFLIAGDIIRTVSVGDSIEQVGTLALIIVIRTFLSMTLHLEVEGRWPWQKEHAR